MKTNLIKFYIATFYFCSTYMMFAQPGSGSDNGGIDDDGTYDVATGAPIDDYVWIMTLLGLLFVFLKFRDVYKRGADLQA
jgi:hypothetical protein